MILFEQCFAKRPQPPPHDHVVFLGKSAIATTGEFEVMFTNTKVHKVIRISKTNQDNPNLQNAFETKHHQLQFCITNTK